MKFRLGAVALLFAGLCVSSSYAVDPSGTWRWEHDSLSGNGTTIKDVLTLKADGAKVTGTYNGEGEPEEVTGKVDGDKLTWSFDVDANGETMTIVFSGDVSGDEVEGTVSLGDLGEFPWTATRDKAAVAKAVSAVGTWRWTHDDAGGGGTINDVLKITQAGDKLSGTYEGGDDPLEIKNAKLDGSTLTWELDIELGGQEIHLAFQGDISGDDVVGNVSLGDFGEFPWEAKRDVVAAASAEAETNKWTLTIEMPDGQVQHPIMEVSQKDGEFTATYSNDGQQLDIEDFKVNEGDVSWTLNVPQMGLTAKFKGQVEGSSAKGVIEYEAGGETGELDWTAEQTQ